MTHRTTCLICGSTTTEVFDLGSHALADSFVPPERWDQPDKLWPLRVALCPACGHCQTVIPTDPEERYVTSDYAYTSGNSAFARQHWDTLAHWAVEHLGLRPRDVIVEIGSNDGYLLRQLQHQGCSVLGVDAAPAAVALAEDRGVPTIQGVFGDNTVVQEVHDHYKHATLVVANNVWNHSEDPVGFLRGVLEILAPGGAFLCEVPSWAETIRTGRLDQIYHEHVSYFSARSIRAALAAAGLSVEIFLPVEYHGGSYRVVARRVGETRQACPEVWWHEGQEKVAGLWSLETYVKALQSFAERRDRLMLTVYAYRTSGIPLVGVGAAAKGNTLLTYCGLNASMVDCVLDSSPQKQGRRTPGTRIPITADEAIRGDLAGPPVPVGALLLAWNIGKALEDKLLALNPEVRFLRFYEV